MNLKKYYKFLPVLLASLAFVLAITAQLYAAANTDGEYLDVIRAADDAEISAAELARSNATSPKVREFATTMVTEHQSNLKTADKIMVNSKLSYQPNSTSNKLKNNADEKLMALKKVPANSKDFDKAYIKQQVTMHDNLLTKLNKTLIPNAKNAEVKKFLEDTKNHVEEHLALAKKIQSEL